MRRIGKRTASLLPVRLSGNNLENSDSFNSTMHTSLSTMDFVSDMDEGLHWGSSKVLTQTGTTLDVKSNSKDAFGTAY